MGYTLVPQEQPNKASGQAPVPEFPGLKSGYADLPRSLWERRAYKLAVQSRTALLLFWTVRETRQ